MQDSSPLQALSDILLGSGASGSSSLLAHSADELYFGESLILGSSADVVLPASLPVYRNSLLDAADNTDAMKARLRTVLDALGLDTTLADTATFSRDSADTISKTVSDIKKSAEQNGWDADSSVLNYLSDAAQLQLNIPKSDWPGGLTITVSNDLRTSVVCNSSAEVNPQFCNNTNTAGCAPEHFGVAVRPAVWFCWLYLFFRTSIPSSSTAGT